MIVPNYVPEPLEVPTNVTQEPYARRLRFIRAVAARHALPVCAIAGLAVSPLMGRVVALFPLPLSVAILAGLFIVLDLWRIARRGHRIEATLTAASAPLIVLALALVARELEDVGIPISSALFGGLAAGFYLALCGRDLSFLGMGLSALALSSAALLVWGTTPVGLAINAAVVCYWVYDLASLLSRRRIGEEWAAAVDLFRDVFNLFGYVTRVLRHWRHHRIWADLPRPDILNRPPFWS